jgi:Tat protein secretion system quality control protein TatD with DNase activity
MVVTKDVDRFYKQNSYTNEALTSYFIELEALLVKDKLSGNKIVAIGECGLDFERCHTVHRQLQIETFLPHFDLA